LGSVPVTLILDTNAWLWLVDSPARIPGPVLSVLSDSAHAPLGLSTISPWEVSKKVSLGKLELPLPLGQWMKAATREDGICLLPLLPGIAVDSAHLPGEFHRDPADQIIVATARHHAATLVTSDQRILDYPHVQTLWS